MDTFTSISEARRATIAQVDDAGTQDQTVSGRHLIQGLGKSFFHVDFGVAFCGRPVSLFGAELDARDPFNVLGSSLRATALVAAYDVFNAVEGAFDGYHTGATICAGIDGAEDQFTWITFSFHGPALRNPIDAGDPEIL